MLESNLSAMQGLRGNGRALLDWHPPFAIEIRYLGKHKAINSMPKLRFGEHGILRDFLAHLALNYDFMGSVDEPVAD